MLDDKCNQLTRIFVEKTTNFDLFHNAISHVCNPIPDGKDGYSRHFKGFCTRRRVMYINYWLQWTDFRLRMRNLLRLELFQSV